MKTTEPKFSCGTVTRACRTLGAMVELKAYQRVYGLEKNGDRHLDLRAYCVNMMQRAERKKTRESAAKDCINLTMALHADGILTLAEVRRIRPHKDSCGCESCHELKHLSQRLTLETAAYAKAFA